MVEGASIFYIKRYTIRDGDHGDITVAARTVKKYKHLGDVVRTALHCLGGFLLIWWVVAEAHAQGTYDVIDLGTLGGTQSSAAGINESGQVAGSSGSADNSVRAFLWTDTNSNGQSDPGEMIDLGTLGGPNSTAQGINESGQVVRASGLASGSIILAGQGPLTQQDPAGRQPLPAMTQVTPGAEGGGHEG